MSVKKSVDRTVLLVAVIGGLVFLNIIGVAIFGRIDMTRDGQFTLSKASSKALAVLEDPVTVRAYFTKDLPPPYSSNARYVKDLLDEYYNNSGGMFSYEFIDPVSEETDEDKDKKKDVKQDIFGRQVREPTSIEQELTSLGVPPVQVRVNEDDKLEIKRAYMGIAVKYRDKQEVIPVVQQTAGLEYDLTTLIRKMSRTKIPKVAFITGHQGPDPQEDLSHVHSLLGQLYEVTNVDLTSESEVPEDVDAALVVGPKTPFTASERDALEGFVAAGHSVAFLLDTVQPDLKTLQTEDAEHGLNELLAKYGVEVDQGLVLDPACATINIQQQRGFMRIAQPVRYPYMPLVKNLDGQHPLTRGLSQVAFPFASPIKVTAAEGGAVKVDRLVRSSSDSWVVNPPYNLDPLQRWTKDMASDQSPRNLVVTLSGPLGSPAPAPLASEGEEEEEEEEVATVANARILVAGGSAFMTDQFMSRTNEALVMNLFDWLVLDEDLLAVRSRGLAAATIEELDDGERQSIKLLNIAGIPVGFAAFGVVRWRLREKKRREVKL